MGLEVVELIMRVEEEFEIEIGDEEAAQIWTAGQLCDLIQSKANIQISSNCLSSATFYQTRRDLMKLTGVSRREIRPTTRLEQIFPVLHRRQKWQQLRAESGVRLPNLQLPEKLNWVGTGLCFGFGILFFAALVPVLDGFYLRSMPFFLATIASLWLISKVMAPVATDFPLSYATVGGLVKNTTFMRFKASPQELIEARPAEIWQRVQFLIADELGVDLEKVTPDADFVRDLGVG